MRCDDAQDLIGALADGELSEPQAASVRTHVEGCVSCAQAAADLRRTGALLRSAGRESAPPHLAARIQAALHESPGAGGRAWSRLASWMSLSRMTATAAACAASALIAVAVTWAVVTRWDNDAQIAHDVLSAHVRSLLQDSPFQVASGDPHSVKPWFNGRVEFAPPVKDLAAEGFPLAGARLDYVGGKRVGALVYRRRLHVVSVFVWPSSASGDGAAHLVREKGYNLLTWRRAGLDYWTVSDLGGAELRELQSLLEGG